MNKPTYNIVIPARYASERLPGKLLLDLAGQPVIEHVWQAAQQSSAQEVVIATDDSRILEMVRSFGGHAVMTSADHPSGSDRIAQCAAQLGWDDDQLIVNLQGDEPAMPASCLDQVARLLEEEVTADVATLCWPIDAQEELDDPNIVKVVFGAAGQAMYFSRAAIPHCRGTVGSLQALQSGAPYYRHLGLYAYRFRALKSFTAAPPTPLEQAERLEQLRFMEIGLGLRVAVAVEFIPPGIDTAQDLERERAARKR